MGKSQPKVLVFENSPFLAIGDAGEWFDTVRREIQRAGYWFDAKNAVVLDTREETAGMLADQAQASGSDCTRHRVERGTRRNQTMSKIEGGLKCEV